MPDAKREWSVTDVPMGHEIEHNFVTFRRNERQPGTALAQLHCAIRNYLANKAAATFAGTGEPTAVRVGMGIDPATGQLLHETWQVSDGREFTIRYCDGNPHECFASKTRIAAPPAAPVEGPIVEKPCPACDGTGGYTPAYVSFGEIVGPDACATCQGHGVVTESAAREFAAKCAKEGE